MKSRIILLFLLAQAFALPCPVGPFEKIHHAGESVLRLSDLTPKDAPVHLYPELVKLASELERGITKPEAWAASHPKASFREYSKLVAQERNAFAKKLRDASVSKTLSDPMVAQVLEKAASRVAVPNEVLNGLYSRLHGIFSPQDVWRNPTLRSLMLEPKGIAGELKVTFALPRVAAFSASVKDGIPGTDAHRDNLRNPRINIQDEYRFALQETFPHFSKQRISRMLDKEIDVVFEGGAAWGEVKNYSNVIYPDDLTSQEHGKSIEEQADETVSLARALGNKNVYYFFINRIDPAARRILEEKGIRVVEQ